MTKLVAAVCTYCLFALLTAPTSHQFAKYQRVESYEIRPGIVVTPVYSARHELCEVSIEKRRYVNGVVDLETKMSAEQIQQLFDELAPREERGHPGLNLPDGAELTDVDGGTRATHIVYDNVALGMYGKADTKDYLAAIIIWKNRRCNAK